MKRFLPIIIVAILAIGGTIAYFATKKGTTLVTDTSISTSTAPNINSNYKVVEACDVLTQADVDAVFGVGSVKSDSVLGNASTNDTKVSSCTYAQSKLSKTVTLLVRAAKTVNGATSNSTQFSTNLPATAQKVSGYGDAAYWDPTYGQLNIYLHNNWYILTSGGLSPADKTLAEAQTFATRIMPRL